MPEGHTTHRLAREHRRALAGRQVTVSSPQGRFAAGAALLDGHVLHDVEAYGKHLLYRWGGPAHVLHVHLGLVGAFVTWKGDIPPPGPACRLRLATDAVAFDLTGPMACELLSEDEAQEILSRLGPDPLRQGARPTAFVDALRPRRRPIAAVLLDQDVIAGIGNAFRAEALFVTGTNPRRPAADLNEDEAQRLWETLSAQLRDGLLRGRIVTTGDDGDLDAARWVYRRSGNPCHRCGTPIATDRIGGRPLYWCPTCQAA